MYGGSRSHGADERGPDREEFVGLEELEHESLRLGHDIRFLFVAVGGGGIRIGREVARHHPRYVETIAINCDASVQGLEEFDRRITLEARDGEELDGPADAGHLARAAEPALERIFEGAVFVTVVGSLGGSAGTGLLPSVVEAASRSAVFVSVFAVKPFAAEHERRGIAERTLARLHFVESFVDKQQHGAGRLQVLDNEAIASRQPKMAFNGLARHWASLIEEFMERTFALPAEMAVEDLRQSQMMSAPPANRVPEGFLTPTPQEPEIPLVLPNDPRVLPAALAGPPSFPDVELTFEVEPFSRQDSVL
jgi:hypothetical protein